MKIWYLGHDDVRGSGRLHLITTTVTSSVKWPSLNKKRRPRLEVRHSWKCPTNPYWYWYENYPVLLLCLLWLIANLVLGVGKRPCHWTGGNAMLQTVYNQWMVQRDLCCWTCTVLQYRWYWAFRWWKRLVWCKHTSPHALLSCSSFVLQVPKIFHFFPHYPLSVIGIVDGWSSLAHIMLNLAA